MQVGEIMSRRAGLIDPATTVAAAARRMRDDGVGCLLVGRSDRLLGIITDRDIVVRTLASSLHAMREPVCHVMSSEVLCCFADQPVEEAARVMAAHGVCRLPVLDRRESLVGIVSLSDLHGGVPKRKFYAVTFYKELADSCGTLHEVSLRTVHVAGMDSEQEAVAAATMVFARDWGPGRWKGRPDGCRVARGS